MGSSPTPGTILSYFMETIPRPDLETTRKIFQGFFGISILTFFGMTFLIENFILSDITAGFVYEPTDPLAEMLLFMFAGVSLVFLVLQFIFPAYLRSRATTPEMKLSADIIRFAICEAIAIFGFLLFLLSSQMTASWVFMGAAFLALLFGDRHAQKAL